MKCKLLSLLVLILAPAFAPLSYAQSIDREKEEVLRMGHLLYRLEKAAWNGTDMVRAQAPEVMETVGGYITYPDGEFTHFTFYDRAEPPGVVASLSFDSTFNTEVAVADYSPRPLTEEELRLTVIRARGIIALQQDDSVLTYENTNLNMIPLVDKGQAKMYVLTGPSVSGVMVFGNDYLVAYDANDEATGVRSLHNNINPINYEVDGKPTKASIHSHNETTSRIITATDVCTLMLYGPYSGWDTHYVIGADYVSIWDVPKERLLVLTKNAWDKISKSQKKSEKKRRKKKGKKG